MGSARVQYELERTLPSLQLAASHGLFSKDIELRDITQKRRQYENALVRRHALVGDYLQYIRYEEDLEKLRVLRVTRLKDLNKIPSQDMIKMQKEAIAHIVSIFERGIKRLRYDLGLWIYYIKWAHKRKMRTVVSRVSARALALFPNKVELWLLVADHELNDYQGASTSRALLQRGLRLNSISHPWSIRMQAQDRPKKKSKKSETDQGEISKLLLITPSGAKEDDEATLVLTEAEQDLIRIWIQYIRMELVFIERLRRRRIVLGIAEEDETPLEGKEAETSEDLIADEVPINNDGEIAPPSIKSMKQGVDENQPSDALLQGAIPKAALKSAVSLQSPSSLPPRAHFALLLAMADLARTFPFCEDKGGLRSGLLQAVDEAMEARYPNDPAAVVLLSISSVLDRTELSPLTNLSEVETKEELQDGRLLRKVSQLASALSNRGVEKMFEEARTMTRDSVDQEERVADTYVLNMLKGCFDSVEQTTQIASDMRTILDTIRRKTLELDTPGSIHFAAQLKLIRFFRDMVERKELGDALILYLKACRKRVLQDARKVQCDGVELERESGRDRLREVSILSKEDATRAKAGRIVETMWKACERFPQDEVLVTLYAQALVESLKHGVTGHQEELKCWTRLQQHITGKGSARVRKIWVDWILSHNDRKWTKSQIESSLSKTMSHAAAHEVLLKGYLFGASDSYQELQDRILFVERKAYAQASFWRWLIADVVNWSFSNEDKINLIKELHRKRTQNVKSDVEEFIAYLRFLILEIEDHTLGLEVFRDAQSRLSKDPSKKIILEEAWQDICKTLRERQEHSESET